MNTQRVWWRWPQNYVVGYLPWYTIAWRLLTAPLVLTAIALLWAAVAVYCGRREANWVIGRVLN